MYAGKVMPLNVPIWRLAALSGKRGHVAAAFQQDNRCVCVCVDILITDSDVHVIVVRAVCICHGK